MTNSFQLEMGTDASGYCIHFALLVTSKVLVLDKYIWLLFKNIPILVEYMKPKMHYKSLLNIFNEILKNCSI